MPDALSDEPLYLSGATLVGPERMVDGAALVLRHGLIEAIVPAGEVPSSAQLVDLDGKLVIPGLIDIHAHGGGGCSFDDPDPQAHQEVLRFHARHGVTTMQASLVSAFPDDLERRLDALAITFETPSTGARLFGVHLEGPHLAVEQCGAHDPAALRPPAPGEADRLLASWTAYPTSYVVSPTPAWWSRPVTARPAAQSSPLRSAMV